MGILAALPLLTISNIVLPLDDPAWVAGDRFRFSDVFLWEVNSDSVKIVERARWPMVKWSRSPAVHIYPRGQGYQRPPDLRARHVIFDNIWTLEGYTVAQPAATTAASTDGSQASAGETMYLELHWTKGPALLAMQSPVRGAPISTFVHVTICVATEIVAQYDGWDIAMRGLEPGDVWVQPAEIALPSDLSPGSYTLSIGLYSPQTGARLPIMADMEPSDAVNLDVLRVEARGQTN